MASDREILDWFINNLRGVEIRFRVDSTIHNTLEIPKGEGRCRAFRAAISAQIETAAMAEEESDEG